MAEKSILEVIRGVAEERFTEDDLKDCFLLDIVVNGKKVEVFADSDEGIKFWQCQKLSRAIEAELDASGVLGEDYLLEVSSPGVDKPLQRKRQYPRNVGRELQIRTVTGEEWEAKLMGVEEDHLILKVKGAKKGQFKEKTLPFDEMESAKVMISFKQKKKK